MNSGVSWYTMTVAFSPYAARICRILPIPSSGESVNLDTSMP